MLPAASVLVGVDDEVGVWGYPLVVVMRPNPLCDEHPVVAQAPFLLHETPDPASAYAWTEVWLRHEAAGIITTCPICSGEDAPHPEYRDHLSYRFVRIAHWSFLYSVQLNYAFQMGGGTFMGLMGRIKDISDQFYYERDKEAFLAAKAG